MVQKSYNIIVLEITLDLLKNGKNHIRGIAKNLKISHTTVMRAVNSMLVQNLLDCRREGKNKVFYLKKNLKARNCIYMAELYKANKFLEKYPHVGIAMADVLKFTQAEIIVLFGSYAKFSAKSGSDIDIFIETKDALLKNKLKLINRKINLKIGHFDLKNPLVKEIIKDHVIVRGVEKFYEKAKFFE